MALLNVNEALQAKYDAELVIPPFVLLASSLYFSSPFLLLVFLICYFVDEFSSRSEFSN